MNDDIDQAVDDSQNRMLVRLVICAGAVMGTVLVSVSGWTVMEIIESRQFRLSGDRYTQQDAARDRIDVERRFSALPPPFVRDELSRLSAEMNRMSTEITKLSTKVERIEKGM